MTKEPVTNFSMLDRTTLKKRAQPHFIEPMLATLTEKYFSSNDWVYEHKFDGIRCIACKKNGNVQLYSRNENLLNIQYPTIVKALERQKADNFIIDGEIIAVDETGLSDFQLLQGLNKPQASPLEGKKTEKGSILFCIFDCMYVEYSDIRLLPLIERKKALKRLLAYRKPLLYTEHLEGDGIALYKKACKHQWEGLIVKKKTSTYQSKRSRDWLKFKCLMGQELVIGGYTTPQGSRDYFGALLVGYYKGKQFHYAGKVGTGYTEQTLETLGKKLQKLTTTNCPFSNYNETTKNVHWVKPLLVAEFQFAEWTQDGKLRVGRFKGLRTDKDAKKVVREKAKAITGIK